MSKSKMGLVVSIALIIILASASVWLYTRVDAIQIQVSGLESDKSSLQTQVSNLQSQVNTLASEKNSLQSQVTALQDQIDILESSKLIKAHITYTDNRPWFGTPYIRVVGEIVNVGSDTAYNSRLRVVLYQGSVIAEEQQIVLGTINGEGYVSVDENIYYSGGNITGVVTTPSWD